ncbi:MAG TPA: GNAT family N-acetyltransferase [Thermoanaerobaculia bacterium]|nr:GNAT family N-acetyltransferase [Thermoanaerobaculia bacterium]
MKPADWPEVAAIYGEGIEDGQATFETAIPSWDDFDAGHLAHSRLVADDHGVIGWAALSPVSRRAVYRGVAEASVYVRRSARGGGTGRALLDALIASSEANGIWTLHASIFPENAASLRLCQGRGFRILGRRERIAQHRGVWRDTLLLERRSDRVGV